MPRNKDPEEEQSHESDDVVEENKKKDKQERAPKDKSARNRRETPADKNLPSTPILHANDQTHWVYHEIGDKWVGWSPDQPCVWTRSQTWMEQNYPDIAARVSEE